VGLVAVNLMLSTVPAPASQPTKHRIPIQAQSGHHAPPYLWWNPQIVGRGTPNLVRSHNINSPSSR